MLRLQSVLSHADTLAARLFSDLGSQPSYAHISLREAPVTTSCIPSRRRRTRRQPMTGSGEVLRSTWF